MQKMRYNVYIVSKKVHYNLNYLNYRIDYPPTASFRRMLNFIIFRFYKESSKIKLAK